MEDRKLYFVFVNACVIFNRNCYTQTISNKNETTNHLLKQPYLPGQLLMLAGVLTEISIRKRYQIKTKLQITF